MNQIPLLGVGKLKNMDDDTKELSREGVPLPVFILLCALALLGIIYSLGIMAFNLIKQRDKVIKMTSPNINAVVLLGACLAYGSMVMFTLDTSLVTLTTMSKLVQTACCLLPISFTLIFGSVFAKSWRVFIIFKNINVNSKTTRDEHILVGVVLLLLLDLAVVLPWSLTDHITCFHIAVNSSIWTGNESTILLMDACRGKLTSVWISVLYVYKLIVFIIGIYVTWQTRHVTLPALRDSTQIYIAVYTVVVIALVCLPAILTNHIGAKVKVITGALAVWFTVTATISLLFVPKIVLWRSEKNRSSPDSLRFQFTESMKKTQEAMRKCALCFCCGSSAGDEDKYATEMLTNEIETLKRSNKDKDLTIRELTDRLYFGTEKFQEYLTTPKRHHTTDVLQEMHRKHLRRTRSTPVKPLPEEDLEREDYGMMCNGIPLAPPPTADRREVLDESYRDDTGGNNTGDIATQGDIRRQLSFQDLDISVVDAGPVYHPESTGSGNHNDSQHSVSLSYNSHDESNDSVPAQYTHSALRLHVPLKSQRAIVYRAHSPNQDSAIDNNSPSADSSDGGSVKQIITSLPNHNVLSQHGVAGERITRMPNHYKAAFRGIPCAEYLTPSPDDATHFCDVRSTSIPNSELKPYHNVCNYTVQCQQPSGKNTPSNHNRTQSHWVGPIPARFEDDQLTGIPPLMSPGKLSGKRSRFSRSHTAPDSEHYDDVDNHNESLPSNARQIFLNRSFDELATAGAADGRQWYEDGYEDPIPLPYQTETIHGTSVSQI